MRTNCLIACALVLALNGGAIASEPSREEVNLNMDDARAFYKAAQPCVVRLDKLLEQCGTKGFSYDDYHKAIAEVGQLHKALQAETNASLRATMSSVWLNKCVDCLNTLDEVWLHSIASAAWAKNDALPANARDDFAKAAADQEKFKTRLVKEAKRYLVSVRLSSGDENAFKPANIDDR
jgi:hypothetical protein